MSKMVLEPTNDDLWPEEETESETVYLGDNEGILPTKPEVLPYNESIQLRLQLLKAQQELDALRRAAERSKAPRESWFPTEEDYQGRADKYGYAIGAMLWGKHRAEKEEKTIAKIASAMGEAFNSDVAASGIRAAVTGFKRAHKQFRFPSIGMTQHSHKVDTILGPVLYAELATAIGECILSTLYSDTDKSPWE